MLLALFLMGTLTLALGVRPGWAISETVYIMSDGSIVPSSAPISSADNVTYTLNGDISYPSYLGIVVQKDNVVIDGNGHTVQGDTMYDNNNGLGLMNQSNVTIKNTKVESFHWGIQLSGCSNCTLCGNNATGNLVGIEIGFSSDNTISGNDAIANRFVGIDVGDYSNDNIIVGNSAVENGIYISVIPVEGGIFVDTYANGNTVKENNITRNRNGMYLGGASNTKIYHNNFEGNTAQVYEDVNGVGSTSLWNDSYPSGGNFWSDYVGIDVFSGPFQNETGSDSIGDTAYVIDVNNTDNYPLMKPYTGSLPTVDWWPMFHHDLMHTGHSISMAPQTNQTLWHYTTGGSVMSSPAVVDGIVYIGSDDDNVYALNATTGAYIWSYTTGAQVFSSPAIADGVVYVGSIDDNVYALNASTGAYIWSYTTGGGVQSSPSIANGLVYVGSYDDNLYALNASTGLVVWNYKTGWWVTSCPAVAEGTVYVSSWDRNVYAFNATSGQLLWSYATGSEASSPAVVEGTVYVGSADGNVYALNASTGAYIWTYATGLWVQSSPAVAGGMVYVGSSDNETYALNASSGTLVWSFKTRGFVFSSPAVADGFVYVGSEDGNVYALDAVNGTLVWSCMTLGWVESSPAVVGGSVYVGSDNDAVYAFGQLSLSPSVFISPRFVTMDVGQSQIFTSMVFGGTAPYAYQWYVNGTAVSGETSAYWIFTPNTSGSYVAYLNVTDSLGNTAESNPVSIIVNPASTTIHDVAVTDVTVPIREAYQGWTINVSVTVANFGNATENFAATLDYDNKTIGSQLVSDLMPNTTQKLLFSWNTTYVPYSYVHNYTITATASIVPGETNVTNNQMTGGQIQIRIMGDVNGDGVVDMKDVASAVSAFNTWPGKARWNPNCDLDLNGIVNTRDIMTILMNFNKHA